MTIIWLIFLIIFIIHLLLGLISLRKYPRPILTNNNNYSIIVVAHNEEKMIKPLLESFLSLNYPHEDLEIILVDDNSNDATWEIISSFARNHEYIKAIKSNHRYNDFLGKKAGLQSALDIAQNDILLFTDADASVPTNWLNSYNKYFTDITGMVIGYIRGENITGIKRFKRIFSSGIFASLSGIGYPFSCSGGNLAIRRDVLKKVGGYSTIKDFPSGDDKQMLNLVKNMRFKVAYNSDVKVIERERVLTPDQAYHQNIRHYGKASLSSPIYQIGFLLIICYYLSVPILAFAKPSLLLLFWLSNISFYILSCIKHREIFKVEDLVLSIIYPYYMLYFSILGTFSEAKWKK